MTSASLRPEAKPWAPRSSLAPHKTPAPHFPPQMQMQMQMQTPNIGTLSDPNNASQTSSMAAKLFVGQLPFESDERRLLDLFSAYGNVEHIHVLRDSNNRSKGAAFVTYSRVEEADTAIFTLHNRYRMLANRMIQVSYAKNSPNISAFGARSAIAVHQLHPTNPVPDVANMSPEDRPY